MGGSGDQRATVGGRSRPPIKARDGGQAGILVIGRFLVGLGFVGLALDVGRAFAERAALRSQADRAALAATSGLSEPGLRGNRVRLDAADAERRARGLLRRSGLDDSIDVDVRVTATTVEVRLRRHLPTVFLRVIGVDTIDVGATASAAPVLAGP